MGWRWGLVKVRFLSTEKMKSLSRKFFSGDPRWIVEGKTLMRGVFISEPVPNQGFIQQNAQTQPTSITGTGRKAMRLGGRRTSSTSFCCTLKSPTVTRRARSLSSISCKAKPLPTIGKANLYSSTNGISSSSGKVSWSATPIRRRKLTGKSLFPTWAKRTTWMKSTSP